MTGARRIAAGVAIAVTGLASLAWAATARGPRLEAPSIEGLTSLRIERPEGHWEREGFVELVTPIAPPTARDERTRVQVFVRIPEGATLSIDPLRLPPGAEADRVESVRVRGRWRVADVRGARITEDGRRELRLLRPERPDDGAPLVGFAWPEAREDLGAAAHDALGALIEEGGGSLVRGGDRAQIASLLRSRGDCTGCHTRERAERRGGDGALRATDGDGFFTPRSVLSDRAPLEHYRPRDVNVERDAVSVTCPEGAPYEAVEDARGGRRVRCPGGSAPIARLDIPAALAAGEVRARGVCEARRFLWTHLDGTGRARYADAMRACAITDETME